MPKSTQRVSFSDLVHYSDDASTSTDSTDDEFDNLDDHTSFLDSDDEVLLNDDESQEGEEELESDDDDNSLGMDDEDQEDDEEDDDEEEFNLDDAVEEIDEEDASESDSSSDSLNDIFKDDMEEEDPVVSDDEEPAKRETVEAEQAIESARDKLSEDSEKETSFSSFDYELEDEKPLSFRDGGVTERPSEYLGGYGPEVHCGKPHRVKLRKSWVANENGNDEEQSEFEAWKQARAEEIAARKAARKKTQKELRAVAKNPDTSDNEETNHEESMSESLDDDVVAKAQVAKATKANTDQKNSGVQKATGKAENKELETTAKDATTKPTKMTTTPSKKVKKEKKAKAGNKEAKRGCLKASKPSASRRVTKPRPKDPETEAHEKEVLEMKETIAKLEIKLNTIEVRTISQLADLEEETAKRMREYRAKADEIVRKQKAKNEKLALKKKAMKSQDVIAQLRKSNQKLRADGVKIQAAIDKLKQSNQALEEKSSVHFGYESEFLAFQKIEVGLAEEINKSLNQHVPHYEKLIRDMEDGVMNRVKSGQIERRAKELYEDCTDSMVDMLEEGCSDPALMDKVASLICLMDTEIQEEVVDNTHRASLSGKRSSALDRHVETTINAKVKPSSLAKALGKKSPNKDSLNPTKTTARRNTIGAIKKTSGLAKLASEKKRSSATGHDSFTSRGARTPCKRSVIKPLPEVEDDASVFTMTSAASGKFSITDYAY